MKSRNGFVSNSSSASFVVHWKYRGFGEEVDILTALKIMYDLYGKWDGETGDRRQLSIVDGGDFVWENISDGEQYKNSIEKIKRFTTQNDDGTFTTIFETSMLNTHEDFGEAAQSFVLGLVVDDEFQIIDTKVDRD